MKTVVLLERLNNLANRVVSLNDVVPIVTGTTLVLKFFGWYYGCMG